MQINFGQEAKDKIEYLAGFAASEKPQAVAERVGRVVDVLDDAGISKDTRTTQAALLAIVLGTQAPKPAPASNKAAAYITVKPDAVKSRIGAIQNLLAKSGYNLTRTTCSALVNLGESNYPG